MSEKTINTIGIIVGVAWFTFVVTVGWQIFEYLAGRFGDQFGALSLFYMFGLLAILFVGRAILEKALIATFEFANILEAASMAVIGTSGRFTDTRSQTFGTLAACTIVGVVLIGQINAGDENIVSESESSAKVVWTAE